MERKTSFGKEMVGSINAYRKLYEKPFYMERLEIAALSELLGVSINVWINPKARDTFGNTDGVEINLYLDLNNYHFTPIIEEHGAIHKEAATCHTNRIQEATVIP